MTMKKKIFIGLAILVVISLIFTLTLTADKGKWTVVNTKGKRIWLVSEAEKAVLVRWDCYAVDGRTGNRYLTYSETIIQSGEDFIMPSTRNVYIKAPSSKVKRLEGSKILITSLVE